MGSVIAFSSFHLLLLVLAFVSRGRWGRGYRLVRLLAMACTLLVLVQLVLHFGFDRTFRGVWTDRVCPLLMLLSGAALFALYRKNLGPAMKWVSGIAFVYPLIGALLFPVDKMLFVIVASPILVGLDAPTVQYSDDRFDIRTMTGPIAPAWLELVEKKGLVEASWGFGEGVWAQGVHPEHAELVVDSDTAVVFKLTQSDSSFVWTFTPQ